MSSAGVLGIGHRPVPRSTKLRFEFFEQMTPRRQRYDAYIQSPEWALMRRRFWAGRAQVCMRCDTERDLQVHHHTYVRLGREELDDLVGLCVHCHEVVHRFAKRMQRANVSLSVATFMVIAEPDDAALLSGPMPSAPTYIKIPKVKKRKRKTPPGPTPAQNRAYIKQQQAQRQREMLTPNEHGFVAKHLRDAVVEEGRIRSTSGGWNADSWRS